MAATAFLTQINGDVTTQLSTVDRGFAYGHGVFETMRLAAGEIPLFSLHLTRLVKGCTALKIDLQQEAVVTQLERFISQLQQQAVSEAVVKLTVTGGVGGRGYALADSHPTIVLQAFPSHTQPAEEYLEGLTVRVCEHRLAQASTLAGHKHLNRLDQVLARSEWQDPAIQEGLVLDVEGNVIEATASNLFARIDDQWVTPDLHEAGVAGVMRQLLLTEVLPALNMAVAIKPLSLQELSAASELFLCNAVMGVRPVNKVINLNQFSVGAWTKKIQTALGERISCYQI